MELIELTKFYFDNRSSNWYQKLFFNNLNIQNLGTSKFLNFSRRFQNQTHKLIKHDLKQLSSGVK